MEPASIQLGRLLAIIMALSRFERWINFKIAIDGIPRK